MRELRERMSNFVTLLWLIAGVAVVVGVIYVLGEFLGGC
jgi:hypothetical protein